MKQDFYLDDQNCINRLFEEWKKYNNIIVAYDLDNTILDYYKIGNSCKNVIELLRKCKALGFTLILFTSCNDDRMPEIRQYLIDNNIPCDMINETPNFIPFLGRKIYYNILLDDRAGLSSAYNILSAVIDKINGETRTRELMNPNYIDF